MPPSVLVAEGDGSWTAKDRLIAVALTIFESTRCSGCGRGLGETWDVEADVPVEEHTCAGCRALDEHRRKKELGPGVKLALGRVEVYDGADEEAPVFE